jgi:hypothetical protein
MELDLDRPLAADAPDSDAERLDLKSLFIDTVRRPSAAMRRLAAHPDRRWLAPLLALAILSVAALAVSLPAQERYGQIAQRATIEATVKSGRAQGVTAEQMTQASSSGRGLGRVVSLVAAFIAPFVAAFVAAAVLHFLGTLLGGQQGYTQMLAATAWARLPLVFQAGVRLLYGFTGNYDPSANGLSGLVAPDPRQAFPLPSPLAPLLAPISIWNLWMLLLFVIAVRVVCQVSVRKALAVVAAYVVLVVVLGELGVVVGRVVNGFAAGALGVGGG